MDYVKILKDLISIGTTVPPGRNYSKALDYVELLFKNVDCETERIKIPKDYCNDLEGRENLLAHRRNPSKQRLILYTHIDVVPVEGWDGFTPRIEDGKMFASGSADNKGSIVALLMALEEVRDKAMKYDTTAIVTVDEEVGHVFANEIRFIHDYLEPVEGAYFMSLDSFFGGVMVASLSGINFEIKVKGKSAHQGRPKLGENAIEKSIPIMVALMKLKEKIAERHSRIDGIHPIDPMGGREAGCIQCQVARSL